MNSKRASGLDNRPCRSPQWSFSYTNEIFHATSCASLSATYAMKPLPHHLTSRIPQELYDEFIAHLRFTTASLRSCSTVCRAWLPTCRQYLFMTTSMTPDFAAFISSSPHAMQTIAPFIRSVGLGGAWIEEQRTRFDTVTFMLQNLENLCGLVLETWHWDFLSGTSQGLLLSGAAKLSTKLTRLHMRYIRFPSFSLLATFMSTLPLLEDLEFDNVTWNLSDCPVDQSLKDNNPSPCPPSSLKRLSIRSCLISPILLWLYGGALLSETPPPTSLYLLSLPEILPTDLKVVGPLLRVLGRSLAQLTLGFLSHAFDYSVVHEISANIDLSHNTELCTLHIHDITLYQFPPANPSSFRPYGWLVPLISSISSEYVTELLLVMWLSAESQMDLLDWPALSDALDQPPLANLRKLAFQVSGLSGDKAAVQEWFNARVPNHRALQVGFSN